MTDVPARTVLSKLAIDASSPSGTSPTYEFVNCSLAARDEFAYSKGIRGTRSRHSSRARVARTRVAGQIQTEPSATEIDGFLPWILGGTTSAGVTALAESIPTRYVVVDKISKVATYTGCVVGRASFVFNSGQAVQLNLDVEGQSESLGAAGSFTFAALPTDNFFVTSDVVFKYAGTSYTFASMTLEVDNVLDAERFLNSTTRSKISAMDRAVTIQLSVPYTSTNVALLADGIDGDGGQVVISDGTTTYTIDIDNVKIPAVGAELSGKSEIVLPLTINCFDSGTNNEFKITKT